MKPMTPDEFEQEMRQIATIYDVEDRHGAADAALTELLIALGYEKGVEVYDEMKRWYS